MMPEFGLTHESNIYVPSHVQIDLTPIRIWNGIIRVLHSFEDDLFLLENLSTDAANCQVSAHIQMNVLENSRLCVLDFHPIHVFLNTESMDRYEQTRSLHTQPDALKHHRCANSGTRSALQTLLGLN